MVPSVKDDAKKYQSRDEWLTLDSHNKTIIQWSFAIFAVGFALWHVTTNLLINEQSPPLKLTFGQRSG